MIITLSLEVPIPKQKYILGVGYTDATLPPLITLSVYEKTDEDGGRRNLSMRDVPCSTPLAEDDLGNEMRKVLAKAMPRKRKVSRAYYMEPFRAGANEINAILKSQGRTPMFLTREEFKAQRNERRVEHSIRSQ